LRKPDYEINVGDSVVVEGRGRSDSVSVYHCGLLMAKVPIETAGFMPGLVMRRTFEWPPPDSLAGRGRAAHRRNCSDPSDESKEGESEETGP
jgi:hypothetical protein